jgi:hypothetical protein
MKTPMKTGANRTDYIDIRQAIRAMSVIRQRHIVL